MIHTDSCFSMIFQPVWQAMQDIARTNRTHWFLVTLPSGPCKRLEELGLLPSNCDLQSQLEDTRKSRPRVSVELSFCLKTNISKHLQTIRCIIFPQGPGVNCYPYSTHSYCHLNTCSGEWRKLSGCFSSSKATNLANHVLLKRGHAQIASGEPPGYSFSVGSSQSMYIYILTYYWLATILFHAEVLTTQGRFLQNCFQCTKIQLSRPLPFCQAACFACFAVSAAFGSAGSA